MLFFILKNQTIQHVVDTTFKWLWLFAGDRYLQCHCLGEVGMLYGIGGFTTVEGWGGWNCIKCLKMGLN